MSRNNFWRGFLTGILIAVVAVVALTGFLIIGDVGHLGRAAEVLYKLDRFSYKEVSFPRLVDGAMEGLVGALDDPYSAYLDSEEYQELEQHISGSYGGIGLLITENEDDKLEVVSPFKGTPAYRAGIKSGDVIVKIGDRDTAGLELTEAAALMKGEPGTTVSLTVLPREGKENQDYSIKREEIHIPSVQGETLSGTKIAYINLMMFSQQTEQDLREVLQKVDAGKASGIILDLRDNPGGDLEAAVAVAGYFIPQGTAVTIVSKSGEEALPTEDNYLNKKLVVLVNGGSASASEIVAGAIKDNDSGTLVGTKTFGKGLVQSVFEIDEGAALKLTTAKYLTPKRHDIHKKGIVPDVVIKMDDELSREVLLNAPNLDRDLQLQKAVEILNKDS